MSERAQALEQANYFLDAIDEIATIGAAPKHHTGQSAMPPPYNMTPSTAKNIKWNTREIRSKLALLASAAPPVGVSPQPDTRRDCTCLGTCRGAEGLGPRWKCALEKSASLSPVEPTPPAEDEDDDEVPVAHVEGAPDVAWSAPLRKPVVPKILSTDDFYALLRILEVLPADPFLSALQSKLSDEERRQHGNQASHLSGPEFVREIERVEALIQSRVQLPALPVEPTPEPPPDAQVCVWREIETAPKDGTRVLVAWEYWSADPFVAYFKHGRWNSEIALSECSDDGPTHWMPLPAPPVVGTAPQGGEQ